MTSRDTTSEKLTRLSIDVPMREHKRLKMTATYYGLSIRDYVLQCVREHLKADTAKVLNTTTQKTFQATDQGQDVLEAKDVADLFEKLGL